MEVSEIDAAYAYCQRVTNRRAGNFRYGIRLLPRRRRLALCAVYCYARQIDDIADGHSDPDTKRRELARMRRQLTGIGTHADPVCVALGDAARRYPIPLEAYGELIDGVEMDVAGTEFITFDELYRYCDRVAGTIGKLCLGVFPPSGRSDAQRLASSLWVGMQLTNILRDISEDADMGRTYLPSRDLHRFGIDTAGSPVRFVPGPAFDALIRFEAKRAFGFYAEGLRILPSLSRRGAACMGTMAAIYHRLLTRIANEPSKVLTRRVSLPAWEKLEIAALALMRFPVSPRHGGDRAR
jgi:15-cis-phytoene synthase